MIRGIKRYLRTTGFIGLLRATKGKVTKSTVLFKLQRHDCKYAFHLRIPSSDVLAYEQIFINQDYDFHTETQPKVIVDAGANIGLASIYFANKYPQARIIAIEPEQSNFQLLKENSAPYPQITPVQAALWNRDEEINVLDPGRGKWGFTTEMKACPDSRPINGICHTVTGVTMDKIIKDYNLTRIDILKIDIEGAEKEVFGNTSSWIETIESIAIELHEHMKAGCARSFYCGSNGFDHEWRKGENIYLSRGNCRSAA
jgi:FkbM family methyltransferase